MGSSRNPSRSSSWRGRATTCTIFDEKLESGSLLRGGSDYEFRLPMKKVTPLVPCRGKAGGMNYAMDILDEHLVKSNRHLRSGQGHRG